MAASSWIQPHQVLIGYAKITDLPPGIYRIIYTSDSRPRRLRGIRDHGSWVVDFVAKSGPTLGEYSGGATCAPRSTASDLSGQSFTLSRPPLLVFETRP